jgi:hypothetical protein
VKATKQLQEKLEAIFKVLGFRIRYEKGNFKSGYCMIEDQKVVVINKFFPLDSKIIAMAEIFKSMEVEEALLDEAQLKLLQKVKTTEIQA